MKKFKIILFVSIIASIGFFIFSPVFAAQTCTWEKRTKTTIPGGVTAPTIVTNCQDSALKPDSNCLNVKPDSLSSTYVETTYVCCCNDANAVVQQNKPLFIAPDPEVKIPTVSLTKNINCSTAANGTYSCSIPWIGEYINGIYKYGINIAGILAAIVLMAGGLLWLISGGDASKITQAKNLIIGSITGLIILMSSYILLMQINPDLTVMQSISINYINKIYEDSNWDTVKSTKQSAPKYCGCIDWKTLYAGSNLKTADAINKKLTSTPLANYGDLISQLSKQNNIDPALVLSIWSQDSSYAQAGAGKTNKNPGNVICSGVSGTGWTCNGRFRQYTDYKTAITDWFNVMSTSKRLKNSPSIRSLISSYAPPSDNNDTQGYINTVMSNIDAAHGGALKTSDGDANSLQKCSDINNKNACN